MTPAPSPTGRRLARNTLHGASGRLVALLVWFLLTPTILKSLGPAGFGVWSLFFALTGNLAALDLGLAQSTLKHVAGARARGAHAEAAAHATLAIMGYVTLGAAWVLLLLLLGDRILIWFRIPAVLLGASRVALFVAPLVFVLSGITNVCMSVAQGYGRFDLANRALLSAVLAQALAMTVVLATGASLARLVVAVGLGWLTGALVGAGIVKLASPPFRWQSPASAWARRADALRFGGPMQISTALAAVNQHVDKAFLARWISVVAVTPYEIGSRVANAVATFPQLLLIAVLPEASALHESRDWRRLRDLYFRGTRYLLTAAALVIAPMLASADRLLDVWVGEPVPGGVLALRLLAVAAGISLSTGMGTSIARGIGRTDLEAQFGAVAVGIHLALAIALVPRWGLPGALCAIVTGNLVGATVFLFRFASLLPGARLRELLQPVVVPGVALLLGSMAGWALDLALPSASGLAGWAALVAGAALAGSVALGVALATGYFPWRELRGLLGRGAA
jgi:O-antigen/teichoic acid export membrane protein